MAPDDTQADENAKEIRRFLVAVRYGSRGSVQLLRLALGDASFDNSFHERGRQWVTWLEPNSAFAGLVLLQIRFERSQS